MPTKKQIMENLETVLVPGVMRSVVKMNLVQKVIASNHKLDVTLALAPLLGQSLSQSISIKVKQEAGQ